MDRRVWVAFSLVERDLFHVAGRFLDRLDRAALDGVRVAFERQSRSVDRQHVRHLPGRVSDADGALRRSLRALPVLRRRSVRVHDGIAAGRPGARRHVSDRHARACKVSGPRSSIRRRSPSCSRCSRPGRHVRARSRLWGTIGSAGIAAGMLFGGVLVQYLGWRSVLFVNVPFAIAIIGRHAFLRSARSRASTEPPETRRGRGGSAHRSAGHVRLHDRSDSRVAASRRGDADRVWRHTGLLFALFAAVERRAGNRSYRLRVLRYPDLISGALVVMLQPMSYAGVLVFASIYVQRVSAATTR